MCGISICLTLLPSIDLHLFSQHEVIQNLQYLQVEEAHAIPHSSCHGNPVAIVKTPIHFYR